MTMKIKIGGEYDRVKEFVGLIKDFSSDLFLTHGNFTVDALSIMGVLAICYDKVLELKIVEKLPGEKSKLYNLMKKHNFLVEEE